jgi:Acetyltransferase (GNAT) domain
MRIVPFAEIPRQAWNEVAIKSAYAWLMHRAEWIDIETRFFVESNFSFALVERDEIVGIQPLFLASSSQTGGFERLLHSGIHRHAGLALAPGLDGNRGHSAERCAMEQIFRVAEQYDVDRIQLSVHNLAPICCTLDRPEIPFWVEEDGFHLGLNFVASGYAALPGFATCCADQIIDLVPPTDVLFSRLDESCRRAVRKAERFGLTFRVTHSLEDLDTYFNLAKRSAQRTGETLPPFDYYESVMLAFQNQRLAGMAFSLWEDLPIAAIFFLADKQSVSFLAGVSDPDHLEKRCNDHAHWKLINWAKAQSYLRYRLGPYFPEAPTDWDISRVSKFKTKFGGRSFTTIQGSFFRHLTHYRDSAHAHVDLLCSKKITTAPGAIDVSVPEAEVVLHHLQLFGFISRRRLFGFIGRNCESRGEKSLVVIGSPREADVERAKDALARGRVVIALLPHAQFCSAFGASVWRSMDRAPSILQALHGRDRAWGRLRTLHPYLEFSSSDSEASLEPVVVNQRGSAVWAWRHHGAGGILLVGTDLARDLVRYRQGDPSAVVRNLNREAWGLGGERPMYLYEEQLDGEAPGERHADWWCWAIRDVLTRKGVPVEPIFPNNAPGVLVVTGDDDQAYLETYEAQLAALGEVPITYFLHPLAKHDRASMRRIFRGHRVELGLHPDALDAPHRYGELFAEQTRWFERLVGRPAVSLRNHGFLNDGYWGHAATWLAHGFKTSSNVPGLDGRILNGSLLPAKLILDGRVVDHWSILTAIGDGVVFVQGNKGREAGDVVREFGEQVKQSGVPGAIVLNLHPQNIEHTGDMHAAVRDLVANGFLAWTLGDLLMWFERGSQEAKERPARTTATSLSWPHI